jgi:hypothetical protein
MTLSASKNLSMIKALEGHFLKAISCNVVFTFLFHYAIVQMEISGRIYDGIRKLFPDFEIPSVS